MPKLTIDTTGKCNLACEFCYQTLDGSILPEEEIYRTAKEAPTQTVQLGGGEPFMDKRITRILKTLCKMGKTVHVSTNATVLPKEIIELEENVRQKIQVQVSLHASTPEQYERITGKNLFDKVMQNTRILKDRFTTLLSTAVYQQNLEDVPNILNIAGQLELPIRIGLVLPKGKGESVQLLTSQQISQLTSYLFEQKLARKNVESPLLHPNNCTALKEAYGISKCGQCPADCGALYISPRNERQACEFLGRTIGGKK